MKDVKYNESPTTHKTKGSELVETKAFQMGKYDLTRFGSVQTKTALRSANKYLTSATAKWPAFQVIPTSLFKDDISCALKK